MHVDGGAPPQGARLGLGLVALLALALWGCGRAQGPSSQSDSVTPPGPDSGEPPPPPPPAAVFQPGFHMALRGSITTSGLTTYRFAIPSGRAGDRIRISIRAGDGPLRIARASVGIRKGAGRVISSPVSPVELRFGGARTAQSSQPRALLVSDPVDFPVGFHGELYVSFAAEGALAASRIYLFPDSFSAPGDLADAVAIPTDQPSTQLVGLTTIEVEAAPTRAFVAIGDSITEGYIEGGANRPDDYRNSWPFVAEGQLGLPVVNAAVSGQGVYEELNPESRLQEEVLSLEGITDCVVLLGTNDLGTGAADIEKNLATLYARLAPSCRVWAGTLPPKEKDFVGSDRTSVNTWIRTSANLHAYVELDPTLGNPPDYSTWLSGFSIDGIHPTVLGSERIGRAFADALK